MPLSNKDLADIAKEFAISKSEQAEDKAAIPGIEEQLVKKQEQTARLYIVYNNAQIERVTPYQTEHRWLNGTTYSNITQSQIETIGSDGRSTYFFPITWDKNNAELKPNGNGNPKTVSTNHELIILNDTLDNQGLSAMIDLLLNGQSSGVPSDTLDAAYSPGDTSINVNNLGHTIGNLLYLSGSGTSALVRITNVVGTILSITELIPPSNTMAISSSLVENIVGFSNSERNSLTSVTYQNILTNLTNNILMRAGLWNTAVTNQLAQLNINIDAPIQITAAKNATTAAKSAYDTWFALPNTGVTGKFTDVSINDLISAYSVRPSYIASRMPEITAALGIVTQDAQGNYAGNGLYLQRYKSMNFLITTANGPLYQVYGLSAVKANFEAKVSNASDKLATFSNLVRYGSFTKDPTGNTVLVDGASLFSNGDTVLLSGNDLPSIECTIVSITGPSVVLSITIPKQYSKAAKGGIIKRV